MPWGRTLYLSRDEATALAEYRQDNPWLPSGTICTFFIRELRVADLSAGFDAECWPSLWADFSVDWRTEWFDKSIEPPTWYMSDDVMAAGLDGILFPSQVLTGGVNLVIYNSSSKLASRLRVYDPAGVLGKMTPSSGS
ncbi:RES family NAD+ phosphorylase [Nitrosomonas sp.]|uniref:RES family NAD+ phosphorylase n=1 Tax=Nitrosomonas sp. TaxID=42353 RepID=UPI0037C5F486